MGARARARADRRGIARATGRVCSARSLLLRHVYLGPGEERRASPAAAISDRRARATAGAGTGAPLRCGRHRRYRVNPRRETSGPELNDAPALCTRSAVASSNPIRGLNDTPRRARAGGWPPRHLALTRRRAPAAAEMREPAPPPRRRARPARPRPPARAARTAARRRGARRGRVSPSGRASSGRRRRRGEVLGRVAVARAQSATPARSAPPRGRLGDGLAQRRARRARRRPRRRPAAASPAPPPPPPPPPPPRPA